MKSTTSTRKTTSRTERASTRQEATGRAALPPLVALVAHFADTDCEGVNPTFNRVWSQMPALMQTHADGEASSIERITRYSILQTFIAEDLAHSRSGATRHDRLFAEGHAVLEELDPDALTEVTTRYVEVAYLIGVAFAAYVLTNGKGGAL